LFPYFDFRYKGTKFLPDNSKYRVKYGINNNFKFLHFLKWTQLWK
jgi:hypothetical protein